MSLKERTTQNDLIFFEILRNPVLCGEFIENLDKLSFEEKFEYTVYQRDMLCDFNNYVSLCTGRSVGKTVSLVELIRWALINNIYQGEYINYHIPGKAHAEPVFTGLIRTFRTNSLLKHFLPSGTSGINSSDLIIRLVNGASLLCRIAGQSGTGISVVGLHSPFVMVDESGYYPYGTWKELLPTLNKFTNGYRIIVSGVPTGLRENNVLYFADRESSSYTKHRVSALQNPRFTEEDHKKALEDYGGEESDDYIHLVLGQHGKPIFALFDRNLMSISNYPIYKLVLDGTKLSNNITGYYDKLVMLYGLPEKDSPCIIGIDLGYVEPTAIFILYIDKLGRIKFHAKIQLNKVDYFIQEKIIDWLDSKYNPIIIGIDEGSAGKAVVPRLREGEEFVHKDFKKIIVPINFSSQIILGTDSAGNEIKTKTKPFSVSLLQEYATNHKLIFTSTDLETVTELERMTYTKTPAGEIVYKTITERGGKRGEDHFTQALLCGILAYYLQMEDMQFRPAKIKLARPHWFIGS